MNMMKSSCLVLLASVLLIACGEQGGDTYQESLGKRFVPTVGEIPPVVATPVMPINSNVPAPSAPSSVVAELADNGEVTLTITDTAGNEDKYEIVRYRYGQFDKLVEAALPKQSGTFKYKNDLNDLGGFGGEYRFRVRAINDGGFGEAYSNTVNYSNPP